LTGRHLNFGHGFSLPRRDCARGLLNLPLPK
jgi:hypothetical protein